MKIRKSQAILLLALASGACDKLPTGSGPASTTFTRVENLTPGQEATLTGQGLEQITSVTVDGIPATSFRALSSTEARFLVPMLRNCETDGRTVTVSAVGASADVSGTLQIPNTLDMDVGDSRRLDPSALSCLQLPAADQDYVLTALDPNVPADGQITDAIRPLFTFQTGPNPTRVTRSLVRNVLGQTVSAHTQTEAALSQMMASVPSGYSDNPIPLDPRYPTATVGDTVRFARAWKIRQTPTYCSTYSREQVYQDTALHYPVEIVALSDDLVIAADLRSSAHTKYTSNFGRARMQQIADMTSPYIISTMKEIFDARYEGLRGGNGRHYVIITEVDLYNPNWRGSFSGIGSDGLTNMHQSHCPIHSEMITVFLNEDHMILGQENRTASTILHEIGHNAAMITARDAPGGGGFLTEPWAVAVQEAVVRQALQKQRNVRIDEVGKNIPFDDLFLRDIWGGRPNRAIIADQYVQGSLFYLYLRERVGQTDLAHNTPTLYQKVVAQAYDWRSYVQAMQALSTAVGAPPAQLLDEYVLAAATDDLIDPGVAAVKGIPQIQSWDTRSLGRAPTSLSRTRAVERTLEAGPAGWDGAYLLSDQGRGISLEFTSITTDPSIILRITRLR